MRSNEAVSLCSSSISLRHEEPAYSDGSVSCDRFGSWQVTALSWIGKCGSPSKGPVSSAYAWTILGLDAGLAGSHIADAMVKKANRHR